MVSVGLFGSLGVVVGLEFEEDYGEIFVVDAVVLVDGG